MPLHPVGSERWFLWTYYKRMRVLFNIACFFLLSCKFSGSRHYNCAGTILQVSGVCLFLQAEKGAAMSEKRRTVIETAGKQLTETAEKQLTETLINGSINK